MSVECSLKVLCTRIVLDQLSVLEDLGQEVLIGECELFEVIIILSFTADYMYAIYTYINMLTSNQVGSRPQRHAINIRLLCF